VEHDETALTRIAPRFGGWVRKLHVNYTGQKVEAGQPLLTVYSPELHATESEYLLAWRQWQTASNGPASELRDSARQTLESARRRLELWEVGAAEIRALEERGAPSDELLIRAPSSGHVIAKPAVEGRSFMPGETLYEIGILHRLWLRVSIPEPDLMHVRTGQVARASFAVLGGRSFETTVDFVYPHLDPQTRRGAVRMRLENPDHVLRPDMWAGVEIEENLGELLSVPASAVIDTGTRLLAFVQLEAGHLEPREVTVGVRTDDWWEVLDGLKEREKVVTRALFLVDSESQLKAVVAGMQGTSGNQRNGEAARRREGEP
jgi:Cu(I)/Ag(I) efflux system membrane fusion protein